MKIFRILSKTKSFRQPFNQVSKFLQRIYINSRHTGKVRFAMVHNKLPNTLSHRECGQFCSYLCSWKFWKIRDDFHIDVQLDSIAPALDRESNCPSGSKSSRIYQNFHDNRDGTVHTLEGTEYRSFSIGRKIFLMLKARNKKRKVTIGYIFDDNIDQDQPMKISPQNFHGNLLTLSTMAATNDGYWRLRHQQSHSAVLLAKYKKNSKIFHNLGTKFIS